MSCDSTLPSKSDLQKLKRQAAFIAEVGTSRDENNQPITQVTNPDTGETVLTIQGIESIFELALSKLGYTVVGTYASNPTTTTLNEIVQYSDGTFWGVKNVLDLPYTIDSITYPNPASDPNLKLVYEVTYSALGFLPWKVGDTANAGQVRRWVDPAGGYVDVYASVDTVMGTEPDGNFRTKAGDKEGQILTVGSIVDSKYVFYQGTIYPISKIVNEPVVSVNLVSNPPLVNYSSDTAYLLDINYWQGRDSLKSWWCKGDNINNDGPLINLALQESISVFAEDGNYLTNEQIVIPKHHSLTGGWKIPFREAVNNPSGISGDFPKVSIQYSGPVGLAAVKLQVFSGISGMMIGFPNQKTATPFDDYIGIDNSSLWTSISDVMIHGSKRGVLCTGGGGGKIKDVYISVIGTGIWLENIVEVIASDNVHFYPFYNPIGGVNAFVNEAVGWRLFDVDGLDVTNTFGIGLQNMIRIETASSSTESAWVNFSNVVADVCREPVAVFNADVFNLSNATLVSDRGGSGTSAINIRNLDPASRVNLSNIDSVNTSFTVKASHSSGVVNCSNVNAKISTGSRGAPATDGNKTRGCAILNENNGVMNVGTVGSGDFFPDEQVLGKNVRFSGQRPAVASGESASQDYYQSATWNYAGTKASWDGVSITLDLTGGTLETATAPVTPGDFSSSDGIAIELWVEQTLVDNVIPSSEFFDLDIVEQGTTTVIQKIIPVPNVPSWGSSKLYRGVLKKSGAPNWELRMRWRGDTDQIKITKLEITGINTP